MLCLFAGGAASETSVEGECFPPQGKVRKKKGVVSDEQSEEFHVFPETKKLSRNN